MPIMMSVYVSHNKIAFQLNKKKFKKCHFVTIRNI